LIASVVCVSFVFGSLCASSLLKTTGLTIVVF